MARRRPWRCYRNWNQSYQHKRSRTHKQEYVRGGPQSKIKRFWGGNKKIPWKGWDIVLGLKVNEQIQISSNALEPLCVSINSTLQRELGRSYYRLRIRPKPFQKIRENRMLSFAGADRIQAGQIICDVGTHFNNLDLVRERLRIGSMKIPCSSQTVVLKYKNHKILLNAGFSLYDDKKRREIPLFELDLP
ncbi:MAG: 50S ribosomal protein L16 [Candidatus Thorarchaeota archaeon]